MHFSFRIAVLLCHAKIDNVDEVGSPGVGLANKEVVWFDVSVNKRLFMDGLDAGNHLLSHHDGGFEGEAAAAPLKQILKRWTKEVNDENVMQAFLAKVIDTWDADASNKNFVRPVFVAKLGGVGLFRFELDSNLLVVKKVGAFKKDTERSLANFLTDAVVDTDDVRGLDLRGHYSSCGCSDGDGNLDDNNNNNNNNKDKSNAGYRLLRRGC